MELEPGRYKFARVRVRDLGQGVCGVWEVRPRLGLIGMLAGWWELKLSSGCPLAKGPRSARPLGLQSFKAAHTRGPDPPTGGACAIVIQTPPGGPTAPPGGPTAPPGGPTAPPRDTLPCPDRGFPHANRTAIVIRTREEGILMRARAGCPAATPSSPSTPVRD
jgi:hypothetical protein